METETILIRRSDGGVSVMTFVVQSPRDAGRNEPSNANIYAAIAKGRLDCVSWRRIKRADLPSREYRDAWTDEGATIGHDIARAREICRARVARKRPGAAIEQRLSEARTVADLLRLETET